MRVVRANRDPVSGSLISAFYPQAAKSRFYAVKRGGARRSVSLARPISYAIAQPRRLHCVTRPDNDTKQSGPKSGARRTQSSSSSRNLARWTSIASNSAEQIGTLGDKSLAMLGNCPFCVGKHWL